MLESSDYPLLLTRSSLCLTCHQTSHDWEKDCLPLKHRYVYWPRVEKRPAGLTTTGKECGMCGEDRTKHEVVGTTQQNVIDKIMSDPEYAERHAKRRSDRANGIVDGGDRPNVEDQTSLQDTTFNEGFLTGTFYELHDFLHTFSVTQRFTTTEAAAAFITSTFGFPCGVGKTGSFGVYVAKVQPGKGRFEFKIGISEIAAQTRHEKHEDADAARSQFDEHLEANKHLGLGLSFLSQSPATSIAASTAVLSQAAAPTQIDSVSSSPSPAVVALAALGSMKMPIPTRPVTPSEVTVPYPIVDVQRGAALTDRTFSMTLDADDVGPLDSQSNAGGIDTGDECSGLATTTKGKFKWPPLPAGAEGIVESGRRTLVECKALVNASSLWNRKVRTRLYENTLTRLSAKATKVSAIVSIPESGEVSEDLFSYSTFIAEASELFTILREDPHSLIMRESVLDSMKQIITKLDIRLKVSIFSTVGLSLIAKPDPSLIAMAVQFANFRSDEKLGLGCMLRYTPVLTAADIDLAASAQANVIQAFEDKVLKRMSPAEFVDVIGKCPCDTSGLSRDDIYSNVFNENGWTQLCQADMEGLRVFAEIIRVVVIGAASMPPDLKNRALALADSKTTLSPRLQAAIRSNSGTTFNNAKLAFEQILSIKDSLSAVIPEELLDEIRTIIDSFNPMTTVSNEDGQERTKAMDKMLEWFKDALQKEKIMASFANHVSNLAGIEQLDESMQKIVELRDTLYDSLLSTALLLVKEDAAFRPDAIAVYLGEDSGTQATVESYAESQYVFEFLEDTSRVFRSLAPPSSIDLKIFQETEVRASITAGMADIYKSVLQPDVILVRFSELWEKNHGIAVAPQVGDDHPARCMQLCSEVIASFSLAAPMEAYCVGLASAEEGKYITQLVLATVDELTGSLPASVVSIFESLKSFRQLELCAKEITEGKTVGMLQTTGALRGIATARHPITAFPKFTESKEVVLAHWWGLYADLLKKSDSTTAASFLKQYETLVNDAISQWNFSGETVKFLATNNKDQAWQALTKSLESFITGMSSTVRIWKELGAAVEDLTWLQPECAERIKANASAADSMSEMCNKTAVVFGSMIMSNRILLDDFKPDHKRYVTERLGVSMESLPHALRIRVSGILDKGGKSSDAGSAPTAPVVQPPVVAAAPVVQPPVVAAAPVAQAAGMTTPPTKRRRFSKLNLNLAAPNLD